MAPKLASISRKGNAEAEAKDEIKDLCLLLKLRPASPGIRPPNKSHGNSNLTASIS